MIVFVRSWSAFFTLSGYKILKNRVVEMIISIMAGGPKKLWPDLSVYREKTDLWVGVDRGVWSLLENDIVPQCGFGDFDSVSEDEWSMIQKKMERIKLYPPEKDETDLEIAFNWACLLYTSPSPRDRTRSRMPSSA